MGSDYAPVEIPHATQLCSLGWYYVKKKPTKIENHPKYDDEQE